MEELARRDIKLNTSDVSDTDLLKYSLKELCVEFKPCLDRGENFFHIAYDDTNKELINLLEGMVNIGIISVCEEIVYQEMKITKELPEKKRRNLIYYFKSIYPSVKVSVVDENNLIIGYDKYNARLRLILERLERSLHLKLTHKLDYSLYGKEIAGYTELVEKEEDAESAEESESVKKEKEAEIDFDRL